MIPPLKSWATPYDRGGRVTVRVSSSEPVNVLIVESGRYPDGPAISTSNDRKWHELAFTAPETQWDVVVENIGEKSAGGAFEVTRMERMWGLW